MLRGLLSCAFPHVVGARKLPLARLLLILWLRLLLRPCELIFHARFVVAVTLRLICALRRLVQPCRLHTFLHLSWVFLLPPQTTAALLGDDLEHPVHGQERPVTLLLPYMVRGSIASGQSPQTQRAHSARRCQRPPPCRRGLGCPPRGVRRAPRPIGVSRRLFLAWLARRLHHP